MSDVISWKNFGMYFLGWFSTMYYGLIEHWTRYIGFGIVTLILAFKFPIFANLGSDE